ncbi:hypothetical protein COCOBI_13-3090 [Coccomyxa sp. Obi]|nr:hypothetical protein COCOBI_13-3090 [Coccomyxa sp. Obi]
MNKDSTRAGSALQVHVHGKGKARASWTPLKNIQKQKPDTQLETQAHQASKSPRPCIKKFLAELQWKILNTPASTYNQPRKRRWLPSTSHMVYSFWDGRCFQMPLADCRDGLRGPEFLDSDIFQDQAQPDDELYAFEMLQSIEYSSGAKPQQGSPEVAPHAVELARRAPVDLTKDTPKGAQSPAAAVATEQKQPVPIPATPVPTTQTLCMHAVPRPHEHNDPQAQSTKILDIFATQPLEATPNKDFFELLSATWKEIQEDPERAASQRGFDEAFIATAFDFDMEAVDDQADLVETLAKKPPAAKVEEDLEESLDDDYLAAFFASTEKEVAPAPQPPAAPAINPFMKELPAVSSLHMSCPELSAAPTLLWSGTNLPAVHQLMPVPRNMRLSEIGPFQQHPPVPDRAEPSPIDLCQGGTQPPAAGCHPIIIPRAVRPSKRARRMHLPTAPSVGPGLLAPPAAGPPLAQDCAPATGAEATDVRRHAATPTDIPSRKAQPCAKRKVVDAAMEGSAEDVTTPAKRARRLPAQLPSAAPQAVHLRWVQHGKRSPQAGQQQHQQLCSPMSANTAEEAWSNLLVA